MKRRLVQHGNTSLTVSLPKNWTEKFNLKKGDEIELFPGNHQLVLQAKNAPEPLKKGSLDISPLGVMTRRFFDAMYKAGYDEVEVYYNDPEQLDYIHKSINLEALTFEIVKQEKNKCLIKNITEVDNKDIDSLIRRTVLLLKVTGEDLLIALTNGDQDTIKSIEHLEHTNNKFTHFCRRALSKMNHLNYHKTIFLYTFVEQLETCADEFKFLCQFLTEERNKCMKIEQETLDFFSEVNHTIKLFNDVVHKFDQQKAIDMGHHRKKVIQKGFHLLEKENNQEKIIIHYLINIQKQVFDMMGPYLSTVL